MDTSRLIQPAQPLYVCVRIPELPVQVMLRLRPKAAAGAVAVMQGTAPLEQVLSVNQPAARLGITRGMTRAELDGFSKLTILKQSAGEESLARAALLEAAGAFTPRVEVLPAADATFAMVLDMTGTTQIFGTTAEVLERLLKALMTLGFHPRLAASAGFHTAAMLAAPAQSRAVVVPPGEEREQLGPLPLAALPLTRAQAEALHLWGLHTLGDLASLCEEDLIVRLGQDGKRLRLLARGEHPHLMVPAEPVFSLREYVAFDAPLDALESVLFVLGPMLDQLLARAAHRAYALASVTVTFALEGGGQHTRKLKPALPVAQRDILLKLLHLDLQAHPPSSGILSILAEAEPGDRSKVQLGLFAPQLPESMRLDVTLARLSAIVGDERVGAARLLDNHRPDAFAMHAFVVQQQPKTASPCVPRQALAMRRCRPPVPLAVERQGQRLHAFTLHGRQYRIEQAFGPWRRSGAWWSPEVWSCEEWDVHAIAEPQQTLHGVLTHDLLAHSWSMAGLYD